MAVITLLLVCLVSVSLVALKLLGILALSWFTALSPVPLFVTGFIVFLLIAGIVESHR